MQPIRTFRLGRCLGMLMLTLLMAGTLAAQSNTVRGTITDNYGEPLVGVSILQKSANLGTLTDFNGNYEINVAPDDSGQVTLTYSYVGYTTKNVVIDLGSTPTVQDVSMDEDVLNLDEVVVTGTSGTSSRKQLGNAISTVSNEELTTTGTANVLGALSGKVSGALVSQNQGDPSGGFSIQLRGPSTIAGQSDPLYIVDGVIVSNSSSNVINLDSDAMSTGLSAGTNRLADINPSDIERIEVVNGAAAAAIYGSLASNGVVQIFTKRGSQGAPKVSFQTSFNVNELRKRLEFNEFGQRFGYPGSERLNTTGDRLTIIADLRSSAERAATPGTGPAALAGRPLVENTYPVTRYDYQDEVFQTGLGTDNYVSISGGTEKTKYFGSFGYMFNQGIIKNTDFQRYGARLRIDQELTEWASLSVGLNYTNSSSHDKPNGNNFFSPISTMIITDNVWNITERDEEGNLLPVEPVRMNPLSVIEDFELSQETNRIISDLQFKVFPFDGMVLGYTLGLDAIGSEGNELHPRIPYPGVSASFFSDGYVSVANRNQYKINHDLRASYDTKIGEAVTSTTAAGLSVLYEKNSRFQARGRDLTSFISTVNAANNRFAPPSESRSEYSVTGYYLQQTFGVNNMFFLTLAGRIDGSSVFGEDERNQFYPKASASLVLSEMDFWKNGGLDNAFSTFKLRATYGQAGNLTAIGPYARLSNFGTGVLPGGLGVVIPSSILGNPDISPERQTEFEIGADFGLFNNRLGVQVTYYDQKIEDLLLLRALAPTSGGSQRYENIGEMTNNGLELLVNAVPVRTKNFSWDVTLAYNTFNNEVQNIGGGRAGILLRGSGGTQSAIDGYPLGSFFARQFARNADGSLLLSELGLPQIARGNDVTGEITLGADGQPSGDPVRAVLGDPNPDWTGSLINQFSFGKLSIRAQFDAVMGFEIYNWNSVTSNNVGNGPLAEQELRGEVPRGWVAAIGGFIGPRIQEYHVEDGSFIKLRELALGYDLGRRGPFSAIRLTLVGRNLLSFDDYSGYDPETNSAGQNSQVRGDDFGNVPIPRTYQLMLNASF